MTKRNSFFLAGVGLLAALLVGWIVAAIVVTSGAESEQKAQMQAFVDQVAIGTDRAAVEDLLATDSDITLGGAYLSDDNIPEGPVSNG